jgi:hypothetical protein
MVRLDVVYVLLIISVTQLVDCRHYSANDATSMLDYLKGSWLVRPASAAGDILTHNFTHVAQLNSSLVDESVLIGTVEPHEESMPPWFVMAVFRAYLAVERVVLPLLGRNPRDESTPAAELPPLFRAFDLALFEENYISGSALVDQRPTEACPGPHHLNLTYVAHYSNTEGQASRLRVASGKINTLGSLMTDEGSTCNPWTRRLTAYTFVVVDDSNIIITLESISEDPISPGGIPAMSMLHHFHMRRREPQSSDVFANSFGTIALLAVVALVKFGPRAYLKWKGINPADVLGARGRSGKVQSVEERLELVKKQRQILEEMKAKKML